MAQISGQTAVYFQSFTPSIAISNVVKTVVLPIPDYSQVSNALVGPSMITNNIVLKTVILSIKDYYQYNQPITFALGGFVSRVKIYNPAPATMLRLATAEAGNGVNMVQTTVQYWG